MLILHNRVSPGRSQTSSSARADPGLPLGGPPWTWLQPFVSLFVSFISASLLERPVNTRPGSSMELL